MANILDASESYLRIFTESFVTDRTLPKWQSVDGTADAEHSISFGEFSSMDAKAFTAFINHSNKAASSITNKAAVNWIVQDDIGALDVIGGDNMVERDGPLRRLINRLRNRPKRKPVRDRDGFTIDVVKFFECIKATTAESADLYAERVEPYLAALHQAQDMGQTALADTLISRIASIKYESLLRAEGFDKCITEQQVVNFVKQTEKGVRLSYIKNYSRPIPQNVYNLKKKADSLEIFDNYCVLYYDPEENAYKSTAAEQEQIRKKKSDPILFGMIAGSRTLYYIGDWVDEYCDLTLGEFMKVSDLSEADIKITDKIKF